MKIAIFHGYELSGSGSNQIYALPCAGLGPGWRPGKVKAFQDLSDEELEEYHRFVAASVAGGR